MVCKSLAAGTYDSSPKLYRTFGLYHELRYLKIS